MNKSDIITIGFHTTTPVPFVVSGGSARLAEPYIQSGCIPTSNELRGLWIRVKEMKPRYGIGRTRTYELINGNLIKSVVDPKKGNIRGIRLIYAESVDAYLASLAR